MAKKWGEFKWGDGTKWGEVDAAYPKRSSLTVKIAGIDRTEYTRPATISIEDVAGSTVKTCDLLLVDVDFTITELDTIEIIGSGQYRWFYGYIWSKEEYSPKNRLDYFLQCVDATWMLLHPPGGMVNDEYDSQSDQAIIQAFMATTNPDIEVSTYVAEVLADTGHMVFEYETPYAALERLKTLSGASWYLDHGPTGNPDQVVSLHYFSGSIEASSYNLSDNPDLITTFGYENLKETTRAPEANKCIVVGKDFTVERFLATVQDSEQGTLMFEFNDGQYEIYDDGQDFHDWGSGAGPHRYMVVVEWTDSGVSKTAWAYLGYTVENGRNRVFTDIMGAYTGWNGASGAKGTTIDSYNIYKADGDYGRWIFTKIVDIDLESEGYAKALADQELANMAVSPTYSCIVLQPGLRAGRSITLTNAKRGLSAEPLVVQRVSTRFSDGGGVVESGLELGRWKPRFEELLQMQLQDGKARGTLSPKGLRAHHVSCTELTAPGASGSVAGIHGQGMFTLPGTLTTGDDQAAWIIASIPLTLGVTRSAVKVAPTGAAIIFDIEWSSDGASWATIYSSKPQIAAGSRVGTDGTLSVTSLAAGDMLRLNIDQVGSTVEGSWLTAHVALISA